MASIESAELICPKCGESFTHKIYKSINTVSDPELAKKAVSGELFVGICPNCGGSALLGYPFLYHDAEKQFIIYTIPEGVEADESALPSGLFPGYSLRVVHSLRGFAEKVFLLSHGADDRAAEVFRAALTRRIAAAVPEKETAVITADSIDEKGNIGFRCSFGERNSISAVFSAEKQRELAKKLNETEPPSGAFERIDLDWGLAHTDLL